MKSLTLLIAALLPCAVAAAGSPVPPESPSPPMQTPSPAPVPPPMASAMPATPSTHVMVEAAKLQWGDPPPALEAGAQAAVLSGDPGKSGLFVIRLKAPAGYKVAPHWHPTDEHVTVLEGDLTLNMGEGDQAHAQAFRSNDYVLLPARMHHAASTTGGMTIQISGMGPFELNYLDPKDDPRKRAAAKQDE